MQPTTEEIFAALRTCRDPEIPVNLVDLGLVYGVEANVSPEGGAEVQVRLTLTSAGCPMSHNIVGEVQRKLQTLPGVRTVRVEIVWEPAWHPGLISEEGRRQLQLAS
ncbi:MAG: metal-sulfur cluster assembly factor [Opitutaceae bacterium]